MGTCSKESSEEPLRGVFAEGNFVPWEHKGGGEREQGEGQEEPAVVTPPQERERWVRLVRSGGEGVEEEVTIGAPGLWPSVKGRTLEGGYLALPAHEARRMNGAPLPYYELILRQSDEEGNGVGFWGVVRGPEEEIKADVAMEIRLQQAAPLEVHVVDEGGAPVEGAFLRLSRDSVGLLHLHYTTEKDGIGRFRAIPPGVYFLTLDAEGQARQVLRLEHSGGGAAPVVVALEEGRGLRTPYSWRGPPVEAMVGAEASSPPETKPEGEIEDGGQGEQEAEPSGAWTEVAVYAADPGGAGVEGAWLEAWVADRRVAEGQSQGNQPALMRLPSEGPVRLVATHGGWGEGSLEFSSLEGVREGVVRMNGELFSSPLGDRIRVLGALEEALAAPLVRDGKRWLVDHPDEGSRAASAGLARGDSLLFLRSEGSSHLVVVERSGRLVEIRYSP